MSTKSIRFLMGGMKTIWQLQRYLAGVSATLSFGIDYVP